MAVQIGSIYIGLDVDIGRISRFRDAATIVDRDSKKMRAALGGTSRSITMLQGSMSQQFRARMFGDAVKTIARTNDEVSRLRASLMALSAITGTGLTAALAGTYLLQTADRAKLLSNQLSTVTDSSENLYAVQQRLYDLSQRTRSSYAATTTIYARAARASDAFGLSQEKVLRMTETIQKAFAVGGATQAESTGAAIQLSQGIASNRFSGEEFRSVAENAPVLLAGIAKSLKVNIGQLRKMAYAGELTAEVVTKAIIDASKDIDEAFGKTTSTVGQAMTRLDNAFLMYIGGADQSLGITRRLAAGLTGLSDNFEEVAKYAGLAGIAGAAVFGGRMLSGSLGKTIQSWSAMREERRAALDALRKEQELLRANGVLIDQNVKKTIAGRQAANVAAQSQVLTAKQQGAIDMANARAIEQINALKAQGVAISERQLMVSTEIAVATKRLTAASMALSVVQRAGMGLLNFFGGVPGLLFSAAIAGAFAYADAAAKAEERTVRLKNELVSLGLLAPDAIDKVAKSLDQLADDEVRSKLREVNDELDKMKSGQNFLDGIFGFDANNLGNIVHQLEAIRQAGFNAAVGGQALTPDLKANLDAADEVRSLIKSFEDGQIEADDLISRLDEIAKTPLSGQMDALIAATRQAITYTAGLLAYQRQLNNQLNDSDPDAQWRQGIKEFHEAEEKGAKAQADRAKYADELTRQAGLDKHGTAVEKRMKEIVKDLPDGAAPFAPGALRSLAEDLVTLDEQVDENAKSSKDAATEAKKYSEGLEKLGLQVQSAGLDKFYQQVISSAEGLGIATGEIKQFIEAIKSGDIDAAPARMREIADAMRDIAAADLSRDLDFERQQMFRSDTDQRVFSSLRDAGLDINSVQGQVIAGQIRTNELLKEARELTSDFVSDFKAGLKDGMSFWDAFAQAGANALDTIADKALDMAVSGIFDMIFGAVSGGFGGKGSFQGGFNAKVGLGATKGGLLGGILIPGILHSGGIAGSDGYNHGRALSASMWAGAQRYHDGTMGAGLAPDEVPAILRRGEAVDPGDGSVFRARFGGADEGITIINHIDARGAQQGVGKEIAATLRRVLPAMIKDSRRRGGI